MTMKPKAKKFRIRRDSSLATDTTAEQIAAAALEGDEANSAQAVTDLDAIRKEGLTGKQLRTARRLAQKNGLAVVSDFDAVAQLRARGIDPFQATAIMSLVEPAKKSADLDSNLPQTVPAATKNLPSTETISPAERRAGEIMAIQKDLAKRRRQKVALLITRLSAFVLLPTILVGWYFAFIATPMYATNSEFVIQTADNASAGAGLGGLFQGTSMATQQDSIAVQSYLASRAAMVRLDDDYGFKSHFASENIDPIQRLETDATNEDAFGIYQRMVKISYDPTEGILRMEVIAADPASSQIFSEALIGFAEEQVDQLTQRLREDQMAGARQSYEAAEARRAEALESWLKIQQETEILDPSSEAASLVQQIAGLEKQRTELQLTLQERLGVRRPNQAQVDALQNQISNIDGLIADIRERMTSAASGGSSLASRNTELRLAEENYTFQTILVQQALTQMEAAQIEANRQVRYLSLGVEPVAPDEATYPRAFENTILAFLIFAGAYLMISLTASILREQVTN